MVITSAFKRSTLHNKFPAFLCVGLPAFTGEGSDGPGSERCSHWGGQEQERRSDQGEMCSSDLCAIYYSTTFISPVHFYVQFNIIFIF